MPGGRLTHDDRREVAAGLASGLGYAEIARNLGRPTSTVSREVARNGGAAGYRADHAHHATSRRARRSRPGLAAARPTPEADGYGRDPEAVRDYVERFAALLVERGTPRMMARVLAVLFTTDSGAVTSADLVRRLQVSPASVSKAVAYLERLGLVGRERDPGERRERYVVGDDIWLRSWQVSADSNELWAEAAREGTEILGAGTPAGARLEQMHQFLTRLSAEMSGGLTDIDPATADDSLTVIAVLLYAGRPLSAAAIAAGLGWPADRVTRAADLAVRVPGIADPVAVQRSARNQYRTSIRSDRLTARQRKALRALA